MRNNVCLGHNVQKTWLEKNLAVGFNLFLDIGIYQHIYRCLNAKFRSGWLKKKKMKHSRRNYDNIVRNIYALEKIYGWNEYAFKYLKV